MIDGAVFPPTLSKGSLVEAARGKYGVAKVYAVALYIDSAAAGGVLKRFASSKPPKDGKFFQTLIDGAFPKTLYLQMLRSVASDTMATALQESLGKRLSADSVAKFRAGLLKALPSDSIAKGAKLFFQCKGAAMTISERYAAIASCLCSRSQRPLPSLPSSVCFLAHTLCHPLQSAHEVRVCVPILSRVPRQLAKWRSDLKDKALCLCAV